MFSLLSLILQKRKQRNFLKTKSQFLFEYLSLAPAVLKSIVSEAGTFACPHELVPGCTLIKVIIGVISLSYSALARVFWLWLLPEPMETTLAESLKTLFNHNQAPYSTKITPFKRVPIRSKDKHQTAVEKLEADIIIKQSND